VRVKVWDVRSGRETSQQMWDAIGKKDSPIEEQKTLIEELESERVHVVAPSLRADMRQLSCTQHSFALFDA
jgi:hypothetical protein